MRATPVTVLSGFLGAGKTTLLNNILERPDQKLAVLVNDFAAINIDVKLIESATDTTISLTNGCVCCSIKDDLLSAALTLAASPENYERIVLETSGVANPMAIAEAFLAPAVNGRIAIDSTICVVDCDAFPSLNFDDTELAIDQAAVADFVLLNKIDLVSPSTLSSVERTLQEALPAMRIIPTRGSHVPEFMLPGKREGTVGREKPISLAFRCDGVDQECQLDDCPFCAKPPVEDGKTVDHSKRFESWSWVGELGDRSAFNAVIGELPNTILRGKGVVRLSDMPLEIGVFQLVGRRASLDMRADATASKKSEIVLIGHRGELPVDQLNEMFRRASNRARQE